ncbi:MAG: hypothetical protein LC114_19435, partial [Bryobacterales bacterium]|nr:hypothetical protein [Bryobacterales bacterium]
MANFRHSILFGLFAILLPKMLAATEPLKSVVFVDGAGEAAASKELSKAFAQLATSGGVIVLRGPVRIDKNFMEPAHSASVTLTSSHGGRDYRLGGGAKLVMDGDYVVNGPTTFDRLVFESAAKTGCLYCNGRPVVFTESVSCQATPGCAYPSIVGAARGKGGPDGADVVILGGQWDRVSGGTLEEAGRTQGSLQIRIGGGWFHGTVYA